MRTTIERITVQHGAQIRQGFVCLENDGGIVMQTTDSDRPTLIYTSRASVVAQ